MQEIWKDVPGYEGYYQVSNFGRVKSLDRIKKGNYNSLIPIEGVDIKESKTRDGYLMYTLTKNNIRKGMSGHRLVALTFISNPFNKKQVNHINGIKQDNHISNLEWVTQSENQKHAYKLGLNKGRFGAENNKSKPVIQLSKDGNMIATYGTAREACLVTGIFWGSISDVCRNVSKTAGGFKWKFK